MKNNIFLAEEVSEHDECVLKYLKIVEWWRIDDLKRFRLEFSFDTNSYFRNSVLAKICYMTDKMVSRKMLDTEAPQGKVIKDAKTQDYLGSLPKGS